MNFIKIFIHRFFSKRYIDLKVVEELNKKGIGVVF
ncbi:hypothetical protein LCGC14_1452400 [marine sediment metagenome]|uniref:Uncharacterized protein n=1 Tax=marine sediment metagenome TaxID=412755 RepID=A0A0F9JIA5_9ZZZZ